jgi:hypothetical protein
MVAVAQLVESRIVIPVVVGSSPISHPKEYVVKTKGYKLSLVTLFCFPAKYFQELAVCKLLVTQLGQRTAPTRIVPPRRNKITYSYDIREDQDANQVIGTNVSSTKLTVKNSVS